MLEIELMLNREISFSLRINYYIYIVLTILGTNDNLIHKLIVNFFFKKGPKKYFFN